jgi:PPP family 3-phenylpropionic acid transporter
MRPGEGRAFAFRASAFSVAVFCGLGVYIPFFPLWLAERGLGDAEIGTIIAAPLILRLVLTPLLTAIADRLPSLGHASAVYASISGILLVGLTFVSGYWAVLVLTAVAISLWYMLLPFTDAVILAGVRDHGIDYGRVRLWGSVGFIAASFAAATAIQRLEADVVLILIAVAGITVTLSARALPSVPAPGTRVEPFGLRDAFENPVLRRALVGGNLILAAHAAYFAFGSLFWKSAGFDEGLIGTLWAFSVIAEIVLFWAVKYFPNWDARRFLIAGGLAAVVRWLLFPIATGPGAAFALQALQGLTFAITHLGVMMAIGAMAMPGHTARVQSIHQIVGGLMLALATAVIGPLFRLSPLACFWAMALLALAGLFVVYRLRRGIQPHRAGFGATSAPE